MNTTDSLFADDPRRSTPAAQALRTARFAAVMVDRDRLASRLLTPFDGVDPIVTHAAFGGGRMCRTHPAVRHLWALR